MESDKIKILVKISNSQDCFEIEFSNKIKLDELKRECCKKLGKFVEIKLLYKTKLLKLDEDVNYLKNGDVLVLVYERSNLDEMNMSQDAKNRIKREKLNEARGAMNQIKNLNIEQEVNVAPENRAKIVKFLGDPVIRNLVLNIIKNSFNNPEIKQEIIQQNPLLKKLSEENPLLMELIGESKIFEIVNETVNGMIKKDSPNFEQHLSEETRNKLASALSDKKFTNPTYNDISSSNKSNNPQPAQVSQKNISNPLPTSYSPNPTSISSVATNKLNPAGSSQPFNTIIGNQSKNDSSGSNAYQPDQNLPFWANSIDNMHEPPDAHLNYQRLRKIYADQLQFMRNKGFINNQVNCKVLNETGGDVNAAIQKLNEILDS